MQRYKNQSIAEISSPKMSISPENSHNSYSYSKSTSEITNPAIDIEWQSLTNPSLLGERSVIMLTTGEYTDSYGKETISLPAMTITGFERKDPEIINKFSLSPFRFEENGTMRTYDFDTPLEPMMFEVTKTGDSYTIFAINKGETGALSPAPTDHSALLPWPTEFNINILSTGEVEIYRQDSILTFNPYHYSSKYQYSWVTFYKKPPCEPIFAWIPKLNLPECTGIPEEGEKIVVGSSLTFTAPDGYNIHYRIHEPIYKSSIPHSRSTINYTDGWVDSRSDTFIYNVPKTDNDYQLSIKTVHPQYPQIQSEPLTMRIDSDGIVTGIDAVAINDTEPILTPVYYTLQGIRVVHPVPGNLYIVRQGSSVHKARY